MNVGEFYQKSKVFVLSKSKKCNDVVDNQASKLLQKWLLLLDISHWSIHCESIDEMQVLDDLYGDNPGNEFVGIAINFLNRTGVIYHTRALQEDDIVHELLHVLYPDWNEQQVNYWTDILINDNLNLTKIS